MRHTTKTLRIARRLAAFILAGGFALWGPIAQAGSLCGNALLDPQEFCDDGNQTNGDGCNSSCQVENNYVCTAPQLPLTNNTVTDSGFEFGAPSNVWNENTNQNSTVLCSTGFCPQEGFSRNGAWWARFGSVQAPGFSMINQRIEIPTSHRYLDFELAQPVCGGPIDRFEVWIGQTVIFQSTGSDARCNSPNNYVREIIDLQTAPGGPYNDGQVHDLRFRADTFFEFNSPTLFLLDNVRVGEQAGAAIPSRCSFEPNTITYEDFDPGVGGDLGALGFATIELLDPVPWGTTDDGVCGSGDVPPGNFTGGDGDAACLDANASGSNEIFSFFCTDALDLSGALATQLEFLLNVQFNNGSPNDFFTVLAGTEPPDPGTLSNYANVFTTFESVGVFGQASGQQIFVDLSLFDDNPEVYICFGFASTNAFYAQVDNVELFSFTCTDDDDSDKLQGCLDNCEDWPNPDQTDSDGDGYGNACDGDINREAIAGRVPGGNGNDCIVNVLDLGTLREAFFARPEDSNWNPDADFNADLQVNVEDLARMKQFFFAMPGPSGLTNTCEQAP